MHEQQTLLKDYVFECRWDDVTLLIKANVFPEDMMQVVDKAASENQWGCVTEIAKHCSSVQQRDCVVRKILTHSQWQCILPAMEYGVSCEMRDAVFVQAAKDSQWHFVHEIMKLEVSLEKRNFVFQCAVKENNVMCAVGLVKLGLSSQDKEVTMKSAIKEKMDFVVELLTMSEDAILTDFVLMEAMRQNQWLLVSVLMKLHMELRLSVKQMDFVCSETVSHGIWDCALYLMKNCISPTQWMVDEAFRSDANVVKCLLALFPDKTLSKELKLKLISAAIKFGRSTTLQNIIDCHGVGDVELWEEFADVSRTKNKDTLHVLMKSSMRIGKLFTKFCTMQIWGVAGYPMADIEWICSTLEERGHIFLALDISISCGLWQFVTNVMAGTSTNSRLSEKVRHRYLRKIYNHSSRWFKRLARQLCSSSASDCRFLFMMAVRCQDFDMAISLYGNGVRLGDVKFALRMALSAYPKNTRMVAGFCRKLDEKKADAVFKYMVNMALKEFLEDHESKVKLRCFLSLFKLYCLERYASHTSVVSVFKRGAKAAVKFDNWICFVGSGSCFLLHYRRQTASFDMSADEFEEYIEMIGPVLEEEGMLSQDLDMDGPMQAIVDAFVLAIKKQRYNLILESCKGTCTWKLDFAIKAAFKQRSWKLLGSLISELKPRDSIKLIDYSRFLWCLNEGITADDSDIVKGSAAVLEVWLQALISEDIILKKKAQLRRPHSQAQQLFKHSLFVSLRSCRDTSLAEWCFENSCNYLSLFLAVAQENWELLQRVVTVRHDSVGVGHLVNTFECAVARDAWYSAITVLKFLPVENCRSICDVRRSRTIKPPMMRALRVAHMYKWVLFFTTCDDKWDIVMDLMTKNYCQDQAIADYVVEKAAACRKWNVVNQHIAECCDPSALSSILCCAICDGKSNLELVKSLANRVDVAPSDEINLYLKKALDSKMAKEMVPCLIAAGLSTFQRSLEKPFVFGWWSCPLQQACFQGQLSLVKLFHRSGVCSNHRLFTLSAGLTLNPGSSTHAVAFAQNTQIRIWSRNGLGNPVLPERQREIKDYLDQAASTPLRLEDLSRQTVSHSLGCQPGRKERIQALPVPGPIKRMLYFSDLST